MNCRHAGFFYVLKRERETTVRSPVSGRGVVLGVGSTVGSMNKKYDPVAAEPSAPATQPLIVADVAKLRWLRAQIHGPVILAEFRESMLDAVADYRVDRGKSVGIAAIITVVALVLAAVAMLVGFAIMQGAADWMQSLREGS